MTDSNERWADSSEKATESYGDIKDSTALGRGSDVLDIRAWVTHVHHCSSNWQEPWTLVWSLEDTVSQMEKDL